MVLRGRWRGLKGCMTREFVMEGWGVVCRSWEVLEGDGACEGEREVGEGENEGGASYSNIKLTVFYKYCWKHKGTCSRHHILHLIALASSNSCTTLLQGRDATNVIVNVTCD